MGFREVAAALLGVSAYAPQKTYGPELADKQVEQIREALGGQLAAPPTTRLRWYLSDLEWAQVSADTGDLSLAAQLWSAMRRDGTISGLMGTLSSGIVGLPKKFYGDIGVEDLKARNGSRSVFDDMFPPSELAQFAEDGEVLGASVGELVPVAGRDFPVFVRLEPEFMNYRWQENRWYFRSVAGMLPITPGDGRWILHTPGGRVRPWMNSLWASLGRSFINKEHAMLHRSNYSAKLANPARVAVAPQGASDDQKQAWFQKVMAWGVNTVFAMMPGYDVKLLESNGRGFDVFQSEIDTSDKEIAIRIAGQVVSVDGGAGFLNMDMFNLIKADIIKRVAGNLAYTLNTQGIPQYIARKYGAGSIQRGACLEWDLSRPKDLATEATSLVSAANAITTLRAALASYDRELDINELTTRFAIPILGDRDGDGVTDGDTETNDSSGEKPAEAVLN